ncbi:hypothetical protein LINGRAHAP2_LOCUS35988 [Linum grandiflorum]
MFAAAGEGIWDNRAGCGRQYKVRCISAVATGSCKPSQTIQVRIVDHASSLISVPSAGGTTIVLSQTAFGTVTNWTASNNINIGIEKIHHPGSNFEFISQLKQWLLPPLQQ